MTLHSALFDGASSIAASSVMPSGNDPWSVSFWFRTASTGFRPCFLSWGDWSTYGPSTWITVVLWSDDASFGLGATVAYQGALYGGSGLNDGLWHFAALSYDGSTLSLYVDGAAQTLTAAGSDWQGAVALGSGSCNIGGDVGNGGTAAGNLDEIYLFSGALSAGDVAWLWNGGAGRGDASGVSGGTLVAGYHFDGDATDFSGNSNDGTWSGTEQYGAPYSGAAPTFIAAWANRHSLAL